MQRKTKDIYIAVNTISGNQIEFADEHLPGTGRKVFEQFSKGEMIHSITVDDAETYIPFHAINDAYIEITTSEETIPDAVCDEESSGGDCQYKLYQYIEDVGAYEWPLDNVLDLERGKVGSVFIIGDMSIQYATEIDSCTSTNNNSAMPDLLDDYSVEIMAPSGAELGSTADVTITSGDCVFVVHCQVIKTE